MTFKKETPPNINKLVKKANSIYWKERWDALAELKAYDCQQSRDVVTRLALHDKVFKVKEEALHIAQALGIQKGGKPLRLTKKDIGYKPKDFEKIFLRIKRETSMEELDIERFIQHFDILNPEMLDVMKFEKGNGLNKWIESIYKSLPKK